MMRTRFADPAMAPRPFGGASRDDDDMSKTNPAEFVREVRQETAKVTWPSGREARISTAMVFVFVIIAGVFFLLVDQILQLGVRFILGFGG